MRNILRIFMSDLGRLRHNVIALIVAVGLVVVPPLYAWFNIAGGWDPYGNTGGMKVAVANTDAGYKSDLIPVSINLGDTVVSQLRANNQLDWQFVNKDQAIEGVKAGDYYAAVVIPEDFSANMLTLFSPEAEHSKILYYENQKSSAVAPEVTGQGASTIQRQVDETFAKTVSDVGLSTVSGLMSFMDGDQVQNYAAHLSSTLDEGIQSLGDTASGLNSFGELLGSASDLVNSTSDLLSQTGGTSSQTSGMLSNAKQGMNDLESALSGSTSLINDALKQSAASYDSVSAAVDKAYGVGSKQMTDTADDLEAIAGKVAVQRQAYQDVLASLQNGSLFPDQTVMAPLETALQSLIDKLLGIESQLGQAATGLREGATNVGGDIDAAKNLIAQAKASVTSVEDKFESTLKGQTDQLTGSIASISSSADGIAGDLDKTVDGLASASGGLAGDLANVKQVLGDAGGVLTTSADSLKQLKADLERAVQMGDLDAIRALIQSDPASMASSLAAPVALDEQALFPMANNGSAMAPFYTTLSLWVGAIVLVAMMRVDVSDQIASGLVSVRLHELYLGRFAIFAVLALCQATLVCAGDLLFFGIQCLHPLQFMLAGWLSSFVFCCIVYTLAVSFGDIGKAISVVLLVMQVAASGGEFPIEMYQPVFQAIYPFLPFVHAMGAMRAAMAGAYGMEYWAELGTLTLCLVPALALGLVFRRPVIRANQWIIRNLESTRLM